MAGTSDGAGERGRRRGAAAAAAMDALDAEEAEAQPAPESDERAAAVARYRALAAVSSDALAEHIRGGERIADGWTHQIWDWTNGEVAAVAREVLADRFVDPPPQRELTEREGFDARGNRVAAGDGGDVVVAEAGERFNDVVRTADGTRRYGTGRGLETAEIQLLRTRHQRLLTDETLRVRQRDSDARFARRVALAVALLLLVLVLIGVSFLG